MPMLLVSDKINSSLEKSYFGSQESHTTFHKQTTFLIMCLSWVTAFYRPVSELTNQWKEQPPAPKEPVVIFANLLTLGRTQLLGAL